ncbi:MAG: YfcE family phosphodiesterase [Defluviitaleaceae bacterium]|nr:YfcE family phosphodiesterase [Defluviitaleaceae bacterium]
MAIKILVLSDSHEIVESMLRIVEREKPDAIFHLGDHLNDALELEKQVDVPVYYVASDIDGVDETEDLFERFVTIERKRFLLIHGHQLRQTGEAMMSQGLHDMLVYGKKGKADVILFGHTHEPFIRGIYIDEGNNQLVRKWLFNPGSIKPAIEIYCESSNQWQEHNGKSSYGLIYVSNDADNMRFEIVDMD